MIFVNGKFRYQEVTGVQRYAREIVSRWEAEGKLYNLLQPPKSIRPLALWEQLLRVDSPEVLWCPCNSAPIFGKRNVVTIHDISDFIHPEWFSKSYLYWHRILVPRILKNALGVITVSEYSKRTILERFSLDDSSVTVIKNGVDCDFFNHTSSYEEVLNKYGIKKPYCLMVGSIDPRKNLRRVLEAWKRIPHYSKDSWSLVIVGGKPSTLASVNIKIPQGVSLTGYVPTKDLPLLYSGAEFFVYPSLFEGFGLPVLEAMACDLPVLTSKTTSLPEVAGQHALLIDPTDVDELIESMISLMQSETLRSELKSRARQHAKTFTWESSAKQTWDYISEVSN